jgi:hypothetical protein
MTRLRALPRVVGPLSCSVLFFALLILLADTRALTKEVRKVSSPQLLRAALQEEVPHIVLTEHIRWSGEWSSEGLTIRAGTLSIQVRPCQGSLSAALAYNMIFVAAAVDNTTPAHAQGRGQAQLSTSVCLAREAVQ